MPQRCRHKRQRSLPDPQAGPAAPCMPRVETLQTICDKGWTDDTASSASQADPALIKLIALARGAWQVMLASVDVPLASVAASQGYSAEHFTRLLRLSTLAPAIVEGRQPVTHTRQRLAKIANRPTDWAGQRQAHGFQPGRASAQQLGRRVCAPVSKQHRICRMVFGLREKGSVLAAPCVNQTVSRPWRRCAGPRQVPDTAGTIPPCPASSRLIPGILSGWCARNDSNVRPSDS